MVGAQELTSRATSFSTQTSLNGLCHGVHEHCLSPLRGTASARDGVETLGQLRHRPIIPTHSPLMFHGKEPILP